MATVLFLLLGGSVLLFGCATLLHLLYLRHHRNDTGFWASLFALLGWAALTLGGIVRGALSGQIPLGSFSDGLLFLLWLLASGYFILEHRYQLRAAGAFLLPVITVGVAYASLRPVPARALVPILQSPWVIWHVGLVFFAYCAFALAGLTGLLYLLQEKELKSKRLTFMHFRLPALATLERLSSLLIGWGYPALTLGILFGAHWSRTVWGAYVLPDPKMIWAVLTWVFYTGFLVGRWVWGWRGRRNALLTIVGFGAIILNYLGISFLWQGIHRF